MYLLSRDGDPGTVKLFSAFFLTLCRHMKVKRLNVNLLKFDGQVWNQKYIFLGVLDCYQGRDFSCVDIFPPFLWISLDKALLPSCGDTDHTIICSRKITSILYLKNPWNHKINHPCDEKSTLIYNFSFWRLLNNREDYSWCKWRT